MVNSYGLLSLLAATIPATLARSHHKTHHVTVGAHGKLAYHPPHVYAGVGDTIRFLFHPKNHTVTQSAFPSGEPCSPKEGGFDSTFIPVAQESSSYPQPFDLKVEDDKPIWVYCRQGAHCGAGMVFAVNPPKDGENTFYAFQDRAKGLVPSEKPPTESAAKTHHIVVGLNGKLEYGPHNIAAAPGDIVEFSFRQKNHTVTQSSFAEPCKPLEGGFKSGFAPVGEAVTSDFPTFSIKVNDTKPIWGYCGQKAPFSHCGAGMVFAINAVDTSPQNFGAFQELAKQAEGTDKAPVSAPTSTHWWDAEASPEPKPSPTADEWEEDATETATSTHWWDAEASPEPKPSPSATDDKWASSYAAATTTSTHWWDAEASPEPKPSPTDDEWENPEPTATEDEAYEEDWEGSSAVATPTSTHWWDAEASPEPKPSPTDEDEEWLTATDDTWETVTATATGTAPAATGTPIEHRIIVGVNGVNTYGNNNIQAAVGDVIVFEFHAKNHTVTQSGFATPCTQLKDGFNSGFMPVSVNATVFPEWKLTVNDTKPIWGYCQQQLATPHCGQGMVFGINAIESGPNNFTAFQSLANQTSLAAGSNETKQLTSNLESDAAEAAPISSSDYNALVRNGYIIIGLLAAVIIMIIVLIVILAVRGGGKPGKTKYNQVSTAGPSVPIFDSSKPYSTPYSDYRD